MHRIRQQHPQDLEVLPWSSGARWAERRPPLPIDRDTQAILRRGLRSRPLPMEAGGAGEPPPARRQRPPVRTWRTVRSASTTQVVPPPPQPAIADELAVAVRLARIDRAAAVLGSGLGAALGALMVRSAGPAAFRSEWLIATLPLVTLWASVGGLVAISIARASLGREPLPELIARSPLGERRSLARPVAIGVVLGGLVVAGLRLAIAISPWLPRPPG